MNCELIQRAVLDRDWDEEALREAGRVLAHVEACEACREALRDYDRVRRELRLPEEVIEAEPDRGWGAFEERMAAARGHGAGVPGAPGRRRRPGWMTAPLALAAGVALLLAGWALHGVFPAILPVGRPHHVATRPQAPQPTFPPGMQFSEQEVREQTLAFQSVSEVFDHQTGWIAVSDRRSEVGLAEAPLKEPGRLLLLRLSVTRGSRIVSRSDLLIVPGQSANLTVPFEQGQQLEYQIGTSETRVAGAPVRLSLWAELKSPREPGQVMAAVATNLPAAPGQVIQAGELVTATGPYELKIGFSQAQLGPTGDPS